MIFKASECVSEQRLVAVKVQWKDVNGPHGLICVYAPPDGNDSVSFFDYLIQFVGQLDCGSFVIFGDFNMVLYFDERWGINGYGVVSNEFVTLVESLEHQDLPLSGSKYNFFESGSGLVKSRLDRFLIKDGVLGGLRWCLSKWCSSSSRIISLSCQPLKWLTLA